MEFKHKLYVGVGVTAIALTSEIKVYVITYVPGVDAFGFIVPVVVLIDNVFAELGFGL